MKLKIPTLLTFSFASLFLAASGVAQPAPPSSLRMLAQTEVPVSRSVPIMPTRPVPVPPGNIPPTQPFQPAQPQPPVHPLPPGPFSPPPVFTNRPPMQTNRPPIFTNQTPNYHFKNDINPNMPAFTNRNT